MIAVNDCLGFSPWCWKVPPMFVFTLFLGAGKCHLCLSLLCFLVLESATWTLLVCDYYVFYPAGRMMPAVTLWFSMMPAAADDRLQRYVMKKCFVALAEPADSTCHCAMHFFT